MRRLRSLGYRLAIDDLGAGYAGLSSIAMLEPDFVKLFDFWMDPRFKATSFDIRDLRITQARSGGVAWFSAILDDCGEWDGKPSCWLDTRWTGVLEKRDGGWRIVQMHSGSSR